jgi:hypothetical protein
MEPSQVSLENFLLVKKKRSLTRKHTAYIDDKTQGPSRYRIPISLRVYLPLMKQGVDW